MMAVVTPISLGQTDTPARPSFSVATNNAADPSRVDTDSDIGFDTAETFTSTNMSLKALIKLPYNLSISVDQQVPGGPGWARSTKFDVVAKTGPESVKRFEKLGEEQREAQVQQMAQRLLAERFGLKVHHETRSLPVYNLIVTKSVSKLKASKEEAGTDEEFDVKESWGHLAGKSSTDDLSGVLEHLPEIGSHLVFDKTKLTGIYDFVLTWTPDVTAGVQPPGKDTGQSPDPSAPSLFTALQEQLGLKLAPTGGPVDVVIIDHVEMPSRN